MAIVVTYAPPSPTGGSGVVITATPGVASDLEGPATIKITRDSDNEVIAQSPPSGVPEEIGLTNATASLAINADGGTYTLTAGGYTTAAIPWNANAAAIEAAITLAAGSAIVHVTGTGPFTLASEGLDLSLPETITANATLLTLTTGTATAVITPVVVGGAFTLDPAGVLTYGPLIMQSGAYHIDVVDGTNTSLLGSTVALTVF